MAQPFVDGDDRLLRLRSLGLGRLQPAFLPVAGLLFRQPLDKSVAVPGVIGRPSHSLELLLQPRAPTARKQILAQAQGGRGPSSPNAQLVDVLRVFIGPFGCQGQVIQDSAEAALQRPHRNVDGPIGRREALKPLLRQRALHRFSRHSIRVCMVYLAVLRRAQVSGGPAPERPQPVAAPSGGPIHLGSRLEASSPDSRYP